MEAIRIILVVITFYLCVRLLDRQLNLKKNLYKRFKTKTQYRVFLFFMYILILGAFKFLGIEYRDALGSFLVSLYDLTTVILIYMLII